MTTPVVSRSLAERLREETRDVHQSAESSTFMARLAAGEVTRTDLRNLTAQLLVVYTALEAAARDLAEDNVFRFFYDPGLERVESLRRDLAALTEPGQEEPVILPASVVYATRIHDIAGSVPALVAHHYTRYLGDLSGGQALGTIFSRALSLPIGGPGLSFYHFTEIAKVKPYKDGYRLCLDTVTMTADDRDAVVAESRVAFRLNEAIFLGLEALDEAA